MTVAQRLEAIRASIQRESVSYGELAELQDLSAHIDAGDVELLQWVTAEDAEYKAGDRVVFDAHKNGEPVEAVVIDQMGTNEWEVFIGTMKEYEACFGPGEFDFPDTENDRRFWVAYSSELSRA